MNEIQKHDALSRTGREQVKLGEWRWVTIEEPKEPHSWFNGVPVAKDGDELVQREELMCVHHIASNHVVFATHSKRDRGLDTVKVRFRDLHKDTRIEPDWQRVLQKRIADKQVELQQAVAALVDVVRNADLLDDGGPASMLPSTTRRDPALIKSALVSLKEKDYPAAKDDVEAITQELVAINKDFTLPFKAEAQRMDKAVKAVDRRLFALEIYAGLGETAKLIRPGAPASSETPVAVRQMMRFMDEESLIDYDKGGMNFERLDEFDEWLAKDGNWDRIAPETRCVVAMRVRRHDKDYGHCRTLADAFEHAFYREMDKKTYLVVRNGEQVWRLTTDVDFSPRLLPLRDEFEKPLVKKARRSGEKDEVVHPDDLRFDEFAEERANRVYEYNRVMFLLQGLLDRSKALAPHPPINLADQSDVDRWFKAVYDEETGLPSSEPVVWEDYRDALNASVLKGSFVWCGEPEETWGGYTIDKNRPKYGYDAARRPDVCLVERVSKDRKWVTLTWDLGNKIKDEWVLDKSRPVPNKPGWFYQQRIERDMGSRRGHQRVEMKDVFAVESYRKGDYKRFLCDPYMKGEYLKWSRQLLAAEKWHMEKSASVRQG